jgi:hypothetical protein
VGRHQTSHGHQSRRPGGATADRGPEAASALVGGRRAGDGVGGAGPGCELFPQAGDVVLGQAVEQGEPVIAEPVEPLAGVGEVLAGQAGVQGQGQGGKLRDGVAAGQRSGQVTYRGRRVTMISAWGVEGQPPPAIESPGSQTPAEIPRDDRGVHQMEITGASRAASSPSQPSAAPQPPVAG